MSTRGFKPLLIYFAARCMSRESSHSKGRTLFFWGGGVKRFRPVLSSSSEKINCRLAPALDYEHFFLVFGLEHRSNGQISRENAFEDIFSGEILGSSCQKL